MFIISTTQLACLMVVRVSKWEAKTTQLTFSQPTTISLQDDEDEKYDDDADAADDEEKYEDDWYFSVANKKRKNEIGANVYGYWHCWLGIIGPYESEQILPFLQLRFVTTFFLAYMYYNKSSPRAKRYKQFILW